MESLSETMRVGKKRIYTNMDDEFWDNEYVYIGKNGFDEES